MRAQRQPCLAWLIRVRLMLGRAEVLPWRLLLLLVRLLLMMCTEQPRKEPRLRLRDACRHCSSRPWPLRGACTDVESEALAAGAAVPEED